MFLLIFAFGYFLSSPGNIEDYDDPRKAALESDALFGGDMIINMYTGLLTNGLLDKRYRWPGYPGGGTIPYIIDPHLSENVTLIQAAMKQYHDNTCIRFVERTNETEYIRIFPGIGCYAAVGRNQSQYQPQPVSLGNGCHDIGTIVHELGHVIGLFHEQNRADRDDYIEIHLENVNNYQWSNFKKLRKTEVLSLNAFDYDSIMIYGNKAFSKNGKMTMVAKNGQELTNPYKKNGLNKSDIERVNLLYKCEEKSL